MNKRDRARLDEIERADGGGWQLNAAITQRRYHFIDERGDGLCGSFGFYRSEVSDGGLDEAGRASDCKACDNRRAKLVQWRDDMKTRGVIA